MTTEIVFRTERALRGYARKYRLDLYNYYDGYKTFGGHQVPALGTVTCGCGTTAGRVCVDNEGNRIQLTFCEACYENVSSMERGH